MKQKGISDLRKELHKAWADKTRQEKTTGKTQQHDIKLGTKNHNTNGEGKAKW